MPKSRHRQPHPAAPLDQILGLTGALPSVQTQHFGAFAITPESLKTFDSIITRAVSKSSESAPSQFKARRVVLFRDGTSAHFDDLQSVLSLRNPRGNPINAIILAGSLDDRKATVVLQSFGGTIPPVVFGANSDEIEKLSQAAAAVIDELRNVRLLYHFVRVLAGWIAVLFDRCMTAFVRAAPILAVTVCLLLTGIAVHKWVRSPGPIVEPLPIQSAGATAPIRHSRTANQESNEPFPLGQPRAVANQDTLWTTIFATAQIAISLAVAFLLPIAMIAAFHRLFPAMQFLIGEGSERASSLAKIQSVMVVTVVISGILIPYVRDYFFKR